MSASENAAFVRAETEKFGAIVKQANIKSENSRAAQRADPPATVGDER
jgi:hypothetical protein